MRQGRQPQKGLLRQVQCDSVALMIESVMCCTDCKSPGVKSVFLGCMNKTELTCVCVCVSVRMCVCETPIWILGHATPLHSASLPHSSLPFSLSLSGSVNPSASASPLRGARMYRSVCVSVALPALLALTLVSHVSQACPRSCNCYQASEVHCTFRSLFTIPPGLPAHTRRINLG